MASGPGIGKTPTSLRRNLETLADWVDRHPAVHLDDIAWTMSMGRQHFEYRAAAVVRETSELGQSLRAAASSAFGKEPTTRCEATAREFISGQNVDWRQIWIGPHGRRIPLPTYSFEREVYAIATAPATLSTSLQVGSETDLLDKVMNGVEARVRSQGNPLAGRASVFDRIDRIGALGVLEAFQRAGVLRHPDDTTSKSELRRKIALAPQHERLFHALLEILVAEGIVLASPERIELTAPMRSFLLTGLPPQYLV